MCASGRTTQRETQKPLPTRQALLLAATATRLGGLLAIAVPLCAFEVRAVAGLGSGVLAFQGGDGLSRFSEAFRASNKELKVTVFERNTVCILPLDRRGERPVARSIRIYETAQAAGEDLDGEEALAATQSVQCGGETARFLVVALHVPVNGFDVLPGGAPHLAENAPTDELSIKLVSV